MAKPRGVTYKTWRAREVLEDLAESLGRDDLDPIEGMARIAADHEQATDLRLDAMKALAQYVYPKLGARPGDSDPTVPEQARTDIKVIMMTPGLVEAAEALAIAMQGNPDLLKSLKCEPSPAQFAKLLPPAPSKKDV